MNDDLRGVRVLIVEDESLVTMLIEDILDEMGCQIVGIASDVEDALVKSSEHELDVAILDVNLNGSRSFRVAERLSELQVPFVFSTGYGSSGLPAAIRDCPIIVKPFQDQDLREALVAALRSKPQIMQNAASGLGRPEAINQGKAQRESESNR
jgi:DNA-binding response OmpR family regulator